MDISSNIHPAFQRNLHSALLAAFSRAGKTTELFVDTRPPETQVELFPALVKAITHQRIQALVAPNIFHGSLPVFLRLNIPTRFSRGFGAAACGNGRNGILSQQHAAAGGSGLPLGGTADIPTHGFSRIL